MLLLVILTRILIDRNQMTVYSLLVFSLIFYLLPSINFLYINRQRLNHSLCIFSGKSTLVKQMKIIHSDGFTVGELSAFRPTVLDNLLSSMKYVLTGMGLLRINLEHLSNKIYAEIVLASPSCFDMEFRVIDKVRTALKVLWKDRGVRLAVARGYDYELNDSAL